LQRKCGEILKKMMKWPISGPFIELVDPVRDGVPSYPEVILHPMAIMEVEKKLQQDNYTTVGDWHKDIMLIWENARKFNCAESPYTHMATEVESMFGKLVQKLTSTPEEEWKGWIKRKTVKLNELLNHPPAELDDHR
jgi:hypothetical protein